ncbi:hypothetical protein EDB95_4079 [Dinghuibacter silviterrae]|uniref:Uncharacterized protein n=2 Tax=Dinghuibacter silviterrae TaxID=1539049 RepID=A0A4R8DG75_9BACT|nr:hypothetical protein EDB95_4079 [Dinghuibacter silviterrae]
MAIAWIGCTTKVSKITDICRDTLTMNTFLHQDIGGDKVISYNSYDNGRVNRYHFVRKDGRCILTEHALQYKPDSTRDGDDGITRYVDTLLHRMDRMGIRAIKADTTGSGIDLTIYPMDADGLLFYVKDPQKVTAPSWVKYLRSIEKIDEHWYYDKKA